MEIAVVLAIVLAAVAAVIVPLVRGGGAHDPELDPVGPVNATERHAPAETERLIETYRHALRAGTVCRRCGRPNPAGSRYCAECGRRLRGARGRAPAGKAPA